MQCHISRCTHLGQSSDSVRFGRAEYVGCFKVRDNADNRLRSRTHRWYDPHHELFDGDGSRYAEGPFYVIDGRLIDGIVRSGLTVRMGGPNEGTPPLYFSFILVLTSLCMQGSTDL